MNPISSSLLQPVFAGLDAATNEVGQGIQTRGAKLSDALESYKWSADCFPPVGTKGGQLDVAFNAQVEPPENYFSTNAKVSGFADSSDIFNAIQNPKLNVSGGLHDLIDEIKNKLDSMTNDLESQDKMGNFQIQDLMSQYNEAESLAASVEKNKDDSDQALIGKI